MAAIFDRTPKAYALLVGINEFKKRLSWIPGNTIPVERKPGELYYAVKSAEQMAEILQKAKSGTWGISSDYTSVTNLHNAYATKLNIIKGIIALAVNCESGDIVTISFSCHGVSYARGQNKLIPDELMSNYLMAYDDNINEEELYILLKLFKPGVRISIWFDMCYAGTWIDNLTGDYNQQLANIGGLEQYLIGKDDTLAKFFVENGHKIAGLDLPNTVQCITGSSDFSSLNDQLNSIFFAYEKFVIIDNAIPKPNNFESKMLEYFKKKSEDESSYWIAYYKLSQSLFSLPVDSKIPDFNKNSTLCNKVFKLIMPKISYWGAETNQYQSKKLFHLY